MENDNCCSSRTDCECRIHGFLSFPHHWRRPDSATQICLSAPGSSLTINQTILTDWLLTLSSRVGWTFGKILAYATGGLAATRLKYDGVFSDNFTPVVSPVAISRTNLGWRAGMGSEYRLTERRPMKGEHLYADLGSVNTPSMPHAVFPEGSPLLNAVRTCLQSQPLHGCSTNGTSATFAGI